MSDSAVFVYIFRRLDTLTQQLNNLGAIMTQASNQVTGNIAAIDASLTGISSDITALAATIAALQAAVAGGAAATDAAVTAALTDVGTALQPLVDKAAAIDGLNAPTEPPAG